MLLLGLASILSHRTLALTREPEKGRRAGGALRAAYSLVLHLTCIYYYLSIPLVLLICVAAGGGLIYAFFMIGQVLIKLVVIIGAIVFYTVVAVVRSLFVRAKDEDPGVRLDHREQPKLAAALTEVAARVGTRPVDSVYLTPHTGIAVLERGGLGKQLRGETERCLVLGVGALDGMKLRPFKAILAHEYGHFSNRDTAGGGFALAVRRSLVLTIIGLATSGAAAWYNPAWWFVRGFYNLFLRVSQGASRLQEVLADRWAAKSYGGEAFARGLEHVVRRAIEFEAHTQVSLHEVIEGKRATKVRLFGLSRVSRLFS